MQSWLRPGYEDVKEEKYSSSQSYPRRQMEEKGQYQIPDVLFPGINFAIN